MLKRATLALLLLPSLANASPETSIFGEAESIEPTMAPGVAPKLEHAATPAKRFAIAVNTPTAWIGGFAYAASGYAALTDHQVLRVNAAYFKSIEQNPGPLLLGALILGEDIGGEGRHEGGTFDVGAGWMYFPRKLWSGPTFEVGSLVRMQHTFEGDDFASPEKKWLDTTTVAGRAMVGWSWDIRGRVFFSIATGASCGYERGTQTDGSYENMMTTTHEVSGWKPGFEWNSRLGTTF